MKNLLTLTLISLTLGTANANTNRTGNELLENLRNPTANYAQGVTHGMIVATALTRPDICVPSNATNGQLIDVVRNFLEAAPALRNLASLVLVHGALIQAFPCAAPATKGTRL